MPYEPLHHKYRPKSFAELVGQEAIATTLINAIRTAKIAPAYLFTGPRGTGKTSSARILAKSLNCLKSDKSTAEPCGVCDVCQGITKGYSLDVIEIDAASNTGVDNIRELIEKAQFAPVQCRYKVYVVDECHMLSTQAFNALLKTLEEPPKHVVFVLATTDPQRVLPTIISRCQRFDFRRIQLEAMVKHLNAIAWKESIDITEEAVILVAQISQGGLRDAESLLDQLALLSGEVTPDRVWDLVGSVSERDLLALLSAIAQDNPEAILDCSSYILDRGREPLTILQNLANLYRDLLIAKTAPNRQDLVACTEQTWTALVELAQNLHMSTIFAGQQHLRTAEIQIKNTTQPRLWLEVTLLGLLPSASVQSTTVVSPKVSIPAPQNNHHPSPPPTEKATPAPSLQQPISPPPPVASPTPTQPVTPTPVASPEPVQPVTSVPAAEEVMPSTQVDLTATWQQVLSNIQLLPRRALLGQMCHLIEFDGNSARVGVKPAWYDKVKSDLTMIAAAFQQTVNRGVEVSLEKAIAATSSTIRKEPSSNDSNLVQQPSPPKSNNHNPPPAATAQPVTPPPVPVPQPPVTPPPVKTEFPANGNGTANIQTPPQPTQNSSEEWEEVTRAAQHLAQFFDGQIVRFADDGSDLSGSITASDWVDEAEADE
ncbi:DNA polymerase III subunit gamma/tau [Nostoc sp. CHAB 5844]|nr:DNA polymerase III subunit gamma/tau [Nostoc sp. CHAB 5844]